MVRMLLFITAPFALMALLAAAGCGKPTAASPPTVAGSAGTVPQAAGAIEQTTDARPPVAVSDGSPAPDGHGHASDDDRGAPFLPDESGEEPGHLASAPTSAVRAQPASAAARRPIADRTPRRPGEAERITFEDLFLNMPADIVFRPFMLSDRAQELDGQRVSIVGYMHGGVEATRSIKEFVLLRNTECKFGPGGQADHLAQVVLRAGNTTEFDRKPVNVEGTLKIEPFQGVDGNTWSIYRLEDAVLK